jgi:ABC-type dipeptide/oligopeptide/nickel transport system permease component
MLEKFNSLIQSIIQENETKETIADLDTQFDSNYGEIENLLGEVKIEDYIVDFFEYIPQDKKPYYQYLVFQKGNPSALNFGSSMYKGDNISDMIYDASVWLLDWSDYLAEEYTINDLLEKMKKALNV